MRRLLSVLLLLAVPPTLPAVLAAQSPRTTDAVWSNYDFVPGSRVLKVVSLDDAPVGRFPAHLIRFGRGTMDVVAFEGKHWLQSTASSSLFIDLPEKTGREFTLEFTLRIPTNNIGARVYFRPREGARPNAGEDYLDLTAHPGIYRDGRSVSSVNATGMVKRAVNVRFQVAGDYGILYVDSTRVAMVPTTNIPRSSTIEVLLSGNLRFPVLVSDIVIAADLPELAATLAAGRPFTTRGILFDTNSDALRPESARSLRDLTAAMHADSGLRLIVEGHTDDVGDEAHNRELSLRRVTSVVNHLVSNGIARERLQAVGKGESEPVVRNDTPEHRQTNRRVVLIPRR